MIFDQEPDPESQPVSIQNTPRALSLIPIFRAHKVRKKQTTTIPGRSLPPAAVKAPRDLLSIVPDQIINISMLPFSGHPVYILSGYVVAFPLLFLKAVIMFTQIQK